MALPPREGIILAAWVVFIPVSLGKLQEVKVVLHLAFYKRFDRDTAIDVMLREGIYNAV